MLTWFDAPLHLTLQCEPCSTPVKENFRDPEMGVSPPFPEIPTSHVTSHIASVRLIFLYAQLDDHTTGLSHVNGLRSNGPWGFSLGTSRFPTDPGIVYENAVTLLPIVKIWITDPLIQMPAGQYGFRFRCGCVLSAGS